MLLSARVDRDANRADVALLRAAANGDLVGCRRALAHGARVAVADQDGMTALHWCAVNWDTLADITGDLIAHGGDCWNQDRAGRTALDILLC